MPSYRLRIFSVAMPSSPNSGVSSMLAASDWKLSAGFRQNMYCSKNDRGKPPSGWEPIFLDLEKVHSATESQSKYAQMSTND